MFDIFELQKLLSENASPSGSERTGVARVLSDLAAPFVDRLYLDAMGNLIAHKKGSPGGKRIMYAAHMDSIGFMINYIDRNGFLFFDNIGGNSPLQLVNTRVRFKNGCRGVIRMRDEAITTTKPADSYQFSDLFIDIGASSKQEALEYVSIGDTALYDGQTLKVAGNNIMTPYADDLVASIALLLTMEQVGDCKNDLYFVFTVQEEVGRRGARTAAYHIDPDVGFACDVNGEGDSPKKDRVPMAIYVGKGPAIKIKDASVICTPQLNKMLEELARSLDIDFQKEVLLVGGTDTSRIQSSRQGVAATCVSIPAHNIHSPCEIYNIDDVKQAAKLLAAAAHAEYDSPVKQV